MFNIINTMADTNVPKPNDDYFNQSAMAFVKILTNLESCSVITKIKSITMMLGLSILILQLCPLNIIMSILLIFLFMCVLFIITYSYMQYLKQTRINKTIPANLKNEILNSDSETDIEYSDNEYEDDTISYDSSSSEISNSATNTFDENKNA